MTETFANSFAHSFSGQIPLPVLIAIVGGLALIQIIAGWKMYQKMGMPGWTILIPIYGQYMLVKKVWCGKAFWAEAILMTGAVISRTYLTMNLATDSPMMLVSAAMAIGAFVLSLVALYKQSKAFGHGVGMTILGVIASPIYTMILGFGKSQFVRRSAGYAAA